LGRLRFGKSVSPVLLHKRLFRRVEENVMKSALILVAALLAGALPAFAQNSIGDAVLGLWSGAGDAPVQTVSGQIYGGTIDATVLNVDGDGATLGAIDQVPAFRISRGATALVFPAELDASRAAFNRWVDANAGAILAVLFPSSISESLTGRDAAQNHSQQFLLTTVLAATAARRAGGTSRATAGGLLEFERLSTPGQSGHAWQGLYQMEGIHTSIQGRVTQQRENLGTLRQTGTRSYTVAADYHPSLEIDAPLLVRVGLDARSGLLYSHGDTLDFGSIDLGGGVWSSVQKDFDKVRLAGAGLLQASKSLVPSGLVGDELRLLADAVNDRGLAWDLGYGMVGGYALSARTSLNGKFLQTVPIGTPAAEDRAAPWLVIGSLSYLVGGHTPVDVGYKLSKARGLSAHSVFVQGYFGW
jgi:hypothetical protein